MPNRTELCGPKIKFGRTEPEPNFLISSSAEPNPNRTELLQYEICKKKFLEMPLLIDSDFSSLCKAQNYINMHEFQEK